MGARHRCSGFASLQRRRRRKCSRPETYSKSCHTPTRLPVVDGSLAATTAKQLAFATVHSASFRGAAAVYCFALGLLASMTSVQPENREPLIVAYLASWHNTPADLLTLPADKLTHVNYAFGKIAEDGTASLADPCLDAGECPGNEAAYPGGNFAVLKELKQKHPHFRSLIAIGGWLGSKYFSDVAATPQSRERFVASCIDLYFRRYPGVFDGIDIDWEFPVKGGVEGNITRPEDRDRLLRQALRSATTHQDYQA